jgi:hypothetical protein
MHKKLMMACMAIAAFAAFVIAPAASASPVLTNSGGGATAVGTEITGKNVGNTTFTGAFNVVCSSADLTGKLTKNASNVIEGEIPVGSSTFTGTGTSSDCTSALGSTGVTVNTKLCLVAKGGDVATVTGCGANLAFTLTITGTGPCKYSTASVSGTHNTNKDAEITIVKQPANLVEGGFFCPGTGELDMVFALTTKAGGTLTIS